MNVGLATARLEYNWWWNWIERLVSDAIRSFSKERFRNQVLMPLDLGNIS